MIYSSETKPNEVTHGGQNAQGKIKCNEDGTVEGYDLGDEYEAYQNQISVSGSFKTYIVKDEVCSPFPVEFNSASEITLEDIKYISEDPFGKNRPYNELPYPTEP